MNGDVHRLRGTRLKGIERDPSYFLRNCRVEQAHLQECFDADTLFYDIFFDPTNRHLVAVGPPIGNLQIDLEIYVNGEPVKFDVIKKAASRVHLVRGKVNRIEKRNDILVKANGHQWQLSVPENNTGTGSKFTLCTLQKDNREHWIKDWIEHYRKIGVDRVILYDNNSEKLPEVDAIVIPCPYRFGLNKYVSIYGGQMSHASFLQRSMLTICSYKYQSGHLLNFDIDELLQVKSLDKFKKRRLICFDCYFVETKSDKKLPENYSFRHFVYRNAHMRNGGYKYMVKMEALLYSNDAHYPVLIKSLSAAIILILQRPCLYLRARLAKKTARVPKIDYLGEHVFYHYKAINTDWKEDRSSFDEATEVVKLKGAQSQT